MQPEKSGENKHKGLTTTERVERIYGGSCPVCAAHIPARLVRLDKSFECPSCAEQLCIPKYYSVVECALALVLAIGSTYGLGARAWLLLIGVGLSFFPFVMVVTMVMRRLVPPPLTICVGGGTSLRRSESSDADGPSNEHR